MTKKAIVARLTPPASLISKETGREWRIFAVDQVCDPDEECEEMLYRMIEMGGSKIPISLPFYKIAIGFYIKGKCSKGEDHAG